MHEPHRILGSTDRLTSAWTPGPMVACTVGMHSWMQLVAFLTVHEEWLFNNNHGSPAKVMLYPDG